MMEEEISLAAVSKSGVPDDDLSGPVVAKALDVPQETAQTPGKSAASAPESPPSLSPVVTVTADGLSPLRQSPTGSIIQNLAGFDDVSGPRSIRFSGSTKLMRAKTGNGAEFVVQYYDLGDHRDPPDVFMKKAAPFLSLSHRHVLRTAFLIPPKQTTGPVAITEDRPNGSLQDVLDRVRDGRPPDFWNETGKVRMILSLISGLRY